MCFLKICSVLFIYSLLICVVSGVKILVMLVVRLWCSIVCDNVWCRLLMLWFCSSVV